MGATNTGAAEIARHIGASRYAVHRYLSKIKKREDFTGSPGGLVVNGTRSPRRPVFTTSWTMEKIRAARDAQLRGDFKLPVQLAESMRTNDALFVAYHNRIAPQSSVGARLIGHDSARGLAVKNKCLRQTVTPRSVLASIAGTLADHGMAIGYNKHIPDEYGTSISFRLTEWPLEHVKWNESLQLFETATEGGPRVPIVHGDGRWTIFSKFEDRPFSKEAAVLPGSFVWAAHTEGLGDWANTSAAHGRSKIMGELPEGMVLQDEDGNLTPEAESFLRMLQDIVNGESAAGIRPAGSTTEFLEASSTAWQVFKELILNREKAAARIYLGTDAILGSVGGAPGVDISTLFGVASTKVQGDFEAIESGLSSGFYEPWTAINCGDSRYAPSLKYQLPDPDEDRKSDDEKKKLDRFFEIIEKMRTNGFEVNEEAVNDVAARVGLKNPPKLKKAA